MIMMMTTIIAKRMLMIMMEITTTELRVHRIAQKKFNNREFNWSTEQLHSAKWLLDSANHKP